MARVTDAVGNILPETGLSGIFSIVTWAILTIVLVVILFIITLLIINRLRFNKKIVIFERIAGRYEPTKKDRAIEMKHGDALYMPSGYWHYIK